ncbi:hypothetical protein SAMN05216323_106033 [Williamwhitmania taraxaci]|uniref:Uncharacterized protein n=2 Tax=Williamwhitmania taraxaci TaxID=1640674 RepID=A0A1G6QGG0_9BACT|nr:hypothetical protein SAMN05216323_106033 [Williamwhitmania taraxaci]
MLLLDPAIENVNYYKENFYHGEDTYLFPILNKETHTTETSIKNRIH